MIEIEKGVPLPEPESKSGKWIRILSAMEVGDSFVFKLEDRVNIQQSISHKKRRNASDKRFTIRKLSNTECRCWRVK